MKQKYFDCHFHIIDKNFPVVPNQGFMPDAFTSEDYLERVKGIDLCGGAVVSGSFQELDQTYLLHALKVLGPTFVGVTQVPQTISDRELQELNDAGVHAVRFNVKRGGSEDIRHLENFARRVHRAGRLAHRVVYRFHRRRRDCSILWCRCRRSASTTSVFPKRAF